jgi:hypothetical protein
MLDSIQKTPRKEYGSPTFHQSRREMEKPEDMLEHEFGEGHSSLEGNTAFYHSFTKTPFWSSAPKMVPRHFSDMPVPGNQPPPIFH